MLVNINTGKSEALVAYGDLVCHYNWVCAFMSGCIVESPSGQLIVDICFSSLPLHSGGLRFFEVVWFRIEIFV